MILEPRARCHHAIRHLFTGAMAAYVRKNPEVIHDEPKLEAATYALLKLMEAVLATIDGFAIADAPPGTQVPSSPPATVPR